MIISTSDYNLIKPFIEKLFIPRPDSHKGQNGRVLIIGGSSLFHASPIWSAEIASHFVDAVHFASTKENNEIFMSIKKNFHNGIVVAQKNISDYVQEDDVILVGPGMVRSVDEAAFASAMTENLIQNYPEKKFVFDAGALQMMKPEWLTLLKTPAIITPHQLEFERLFGIKISSKELSEKVEIVKQTAKRYNTTILMKAVDDIISNGTEEYIIQGGNQGLTKGGTGDLLAGLAAALYSKNNSVASAVLASYILKKSADTLEKTYGYWYNNDNLIETIPITLSKLVKQI